MNFLFNEMTKEWIWLPVWSAIVGVVAGWMFTRIVGGLRSSAKWPAPPVDFPADRSPTYVLPMRLEVSVKQGGFSQLGDIFYMLPLLLTVFYFQYRFWYLAVFSIVAALSWGFTLVVCIWLVRRENWSGQPYGGAISGLILGSFILFVGYAFAQNPPRIQIPSVAYFLTSGTITLPDLGLTGLFWLSCHVGGMIILVFVAEAMLFLGLGTVARAFEGNGFWSWLDNATSWQTCRPRLSVFLIVFFGIIGVLLLGGWGFDLYTLWLKVQGSRTNW